ncbi:MAG: phytanoyl-CoA hydroxylase [Verrucomicrobiales bacterium]|jgi:phytanoyl-CoA hydroxylase
MVLSREEIQTYERDGSLVVRGIVTPQEVDDLRTAAEHFEAQAQLLDVSSPVIELDDIASRASGEQRIRRIKSPHLNHDVFAGQLRSPVLLDMVEQLIGPNIRWHHTKLNAKQPSGSGHVEWHTDWGYYPHTNCDLLEIGIAIDPSTIENGCLQVLPATHAGPALDHTEDGVFVGAVRPGSVDAEETESLVLEPGDISIHHVRLLHGSGPNRSDAQRRLLLQGYAAADAWPIMAQHQPLDWPEWDDRILRGEPTTHARLDGSPVRVPLPVTAALGLFDTQRLMKSSHFGGGTSREVVSP